MEVVMKLPVESVEVWLPSPGLGNRRATKHKYSHSEMVAVRCGDKMITGLGHFYRCSETSVLRRWGFDAGGFN